MQYLLVDTYADTQELKEYNELKDLYIEEIKKDLLENIEDKDIVRKGVNILVETIKGKTIPIKTIEDSLECYGYKIIDLLQIQRDLEDIKKYFEKRYYTNDFKVVIEMINNEVNKNE
jgi:N-acetyl-anhydromuramyl-L-alanine amidase AmpD